MAQTGFTPIQIYSSSTAAAAPAAGSLTNSTLGSELAINITDGKLFYKDNANNVQVIGWKVVPTSAGGTGLTSFTANRVFYAGTTSTVNQSANLTFDGTTLTAANFTDSSLTSGRVTYAGTGGNLVDSTNFTFDGTNANLAGTGAQLIIGFTSTPVSGASATVQGTAAGFAAVRYATTAGLQPYVNLYRSQGTTIGTPSAVNSGDGLGRLTTFGYDGAGYQSATEIRSEADAAPTSGTSTPGRIVFATQTAAGILTERTRFTSAGQYLFGTTSSTTGNFVVGTAQANAQYNLLVSGANTYANATVGAFHNASVITGTAATTSMRGISNINNWAPAVGASIANVYGVFNQTALNSTITPTNYHSVWSAVQLTSSATGGTITSSYSYNAGAPVFDASATTNITNHYHYFAGTIANGAAQTITNGYGFYGNVASGTGRYNFYAAGTAQNAFSGDVLIFGAGALGYTSGSGGSVTQATNKSTGVTLNKTNGKITMSNAALAANTAVSFLLSNTTITANDVVVLSFGSGPGGMEVNYTLSCVAVANGAYIGLRNMTAGSLSEAVVINFAVIKATTA
jgi:hypothetical protein